MRRVDPLIVLQARIDARARLWKDGEYADEGELMQPLYRFAQRHNLPLQVEDIDGLMLAALEGKA
jgi:hypothetical protein